VLGSGKEGSPPLVIGIESEKLVFNRTSD